MYYATCGQPSRLFTLKSIKHHGGPRDVRASFCCILGKTLHRSRAGKTQSSTLAWFADLRLEGAFYYIKIIVLTMGLDVVECSPSTHEAQSYTKRSW